MTTFEGGGTADRGKGGSSWREGGGGVIQCHSFGHKKVGKWG
jgi:hypothetical protein